MTQVLAQTTALLVVDVQRGFDDASWGRRDNPHCEQNIVRLINRWQARRWPVVYVRHDSTEVGSPLGPNQRGNDLSPVLPPDPDLLVVKKVNSAFHGAPDLDRWLTSAGLRGVAICGITTNHCCETTARVAANLGYAVHFVLDATATFDRLSPAGEAVPAETLSLVTATNLHGEFAVVTTTAQLLT